MISLRPADRFGGCRPPPRPYSESSHNFRRHRWCCASNYGHGPGSCTKKVLAKTNLNISLMDVIELNEASASQGLAVLRELAWR